MKRASRRMPVIRKLPALLIVGLLGTAGVVLAAQSQSETTLAPQIVTGEVVRYEPRRVLVVRGADGKELPLASGPTAVCNTSIPSSAPSTRWP